LILTAVIGLSASRAVAADDNPVPRTDGPSSQDYPALHNLLAVSPRIYSGGEPDGDAAFEALRKLGVKTIVSVDGARPDAAAARKYGLRYVHIPIGYDGIPAEAAAALTRVMREADAPVYVHCHHGKHRGPAAAAVACIASGDTDGAGALKILEQAGTGKEYRGLWRDVAAFRPLPRLAKLPALVEAADVESLTAAMAEIDRAFDELKRSRRAGWGVPAEHPDLVPAAQATLLRERFHESARLLAGDEKRDARFKQRLAEAEAVARKLETALQAGEKLQAEQSYQRLEQRCNECHAAYRN
jgi:protein tyrosine phosphatase (PTP) superfamily phosphohydrolase (DUF442 family)